MNRQQREQLEAFSNEISRSKGDDLLLKYVQFKDSDESREPDLGILKSGQLEAALQSEFGIMWKRDTKDRRDEIEQSIRDQSKSDES